MIVKIQKSGAIILSSKNKNNVALLYRNKQDDWSFPKGHVEQGEHAFQAMIREIKEETGLDVKPIQELPDSLYFNMTEGQIITKMFLVASVDDSKLKTEFKKDKIRWIPRNKVIEKLSYGNLKDYFNSVLAILEKNVSS